MSTLVQLTPETSRLRTQAMLIHGLTLSQLEAAPTPVEVAAHSWIPSEPASISAAGTSVSIRSFSGAFDQAGRLQDFDTFRYHRLDLWSLLELACCV